MYFVCTDSGRQPIAHATLEQALANLRGELRARESQGFTVTFNDKLEFVLTRKDGSENPDGHPYRIWVEDQDGQNVTSRDAAEAG